MGGYLRGAAVVAAVLAGCGPLSAGAAPGGHSGGAAPAAAESQWAETVTPHFDVHHEAAFAPPAFAIFLEKLHSRLRFDMSQFSPWMARERIHLYLYASPRSYWGGEFRPPSWSNGIADYNRKLVAVYDQPDRGKLYGVAAHEMTHLLFESYWGEAHRTPPHWLNEGLAMVEESEAADDPKTSDWYRGMASLPTGQLVEFGRLARTSPATDLRGKDEVVFWYVESYAAVYYLYRQHSRLQFFNFCRKLRDGVPLTQALWDAYRFRDLNAFQSAWKRWLQETFRAPPYRPGAGSGAPGSSGTPSSGLHRMDPAGFSFHSLLEGNEGPRGR